VAKMKKSFESGVTRVNFDIPCEFHRELKTKFASEGKTFKGVIVPFLEACLRGEEPVKKVQENGNPDEGIESLDEKIEKIVESKLAEKEDGKADELKVHTVEPVEIQAKREGIQANGKDIEVLVLKEKVAVAKDGLVAKDGVMAKEIIVAEEIVLAEKAKILVRAKKKISGLKFPFDFDDDFYEAWALVEADEKRKKEDSEKKSEAEEID